MTGAMMLGRIAYKLSTLNGQALPEYGGVNMSGKIAHNGTQIEAANSRSKFINIHSTLRLQGYLQFFMDIVIFPRLLGG